MSTDVTATKDKASIRTHDVRFGEIDIREYRMTIGDNPCVSIGPPVALSWDYQPAGTQSIDEFERSRQGRRRNQRRLRLNYYQRIEILESAGVEQKEIKQAERQIFVDQSNRKFSMYLCYLQVVLGDVRASHGRRKNKRLLRKMEREANMKGPKQ